MSVLAEIIRGVVEDLGARKLQVSREEIIARANEQSSPRDVLESFQQGTFGVIAEVKRSSPSKGALADISDPATLARKYQEGGACAVSVLTEERRFKGSLSDLAAVRAAVTIPILRKEFIVDDYQIYESRAFGADIVLLIVAALTDAQLLQFTTLTHSLGMRTLIEVHEVTELERVLQLVRSGKLSLDLLGINARNLKTLDINSGLFAEMVSHIPASIPLIAESGISSADEVGELARVGADGVLVGEALVKDGHPAQTIKDFLHRAHSLRVRRLSP